MLFEPPGIGKSSLIAAMANYLNFDIYDLQFRNLIGNSQLRQLLISTANRSILVVEDIDCSLELQDRRTQQPRMMNLDLARMMNIDPYPTTQVHFFSLSSIDLLYKKKFQSPKFYLFSLFLDFDSIARGLFHFFSSVFCRISFSDSFIYLG